MLVIENTDTTIMQHHKNPLQHARQEATFEVLQLKKMIDGKYGEFKKMVYATLENDPWFRNPELQLDLNKEDTRQLYIHQMIRFFEVITALVIILTKSSTNLSLRRNTFRNP